MINEKLKYQERQGYEGEALLPLASLRQKAEAIAEPEVARLGALKQKNV